jgi:hypothetical protein
MLIYLIFIPIPFLRQGYTKGIQKGSRWMQGKLRKIKISSYEHCKIEDGHLLYKKKRAHQLMHPQS